ncbi:MAG: glycyl-radical enzyme activating protein, partial [Bacteroidales bacterium]|nr:glycyl-radical enzyme activating protein [Bacteroidales bacterium]
LCFECVEVCHSQAFSIVGETVNLESILATVDKYHDFYKTSGGGITLSGGEFTLQSSFSGKLLKEIKKRGIHTLVETSGHFSYSVFESNILPYIDQIYMDIKILDEENHKKYCGVSNKLILENFSKLYKAHKDGKTKVLPRIPLIPNVTATTENLKSIADFLRKNEVTEISLLPYNPTWDEKSVRIGVDVDYLNQKWMSADEINYCHSFFQDFKIV